MSDYTPSGKPATDALGSSSDIRAEFVLIQTAIATKLNSNATAINNLTLGRGTGGIAGNIGIGTSALTANTTGVQNVALGTGALTHTTIGDSNTAIGDTALAANVGGAQNTAIGSLAIGNSASGSGNTGLGFRAGLTLTSGSNNIVIGNIADCSSASVSNEATIGNSSISALRCHVTSITSLSDARDKTDVVDLPSGLDVITALRPVRFTWNMRDGGKVGVKDSGFIAQDLQAVDDDWLKLVYAENPEKLEASYGRLIPVLVRAIQDLAIQFEEYKAQHP